jgi:capsular exopolysaccharide synthesis family protein
MAHELDGPEDAPASSPFIPVFQIALDVLSLLLRHWFLVILGVAVGAGWAANKAYKEPDLYSASAKILVDESASPTGEPVDPQDPQAERKMALLRRIEVLRSIPVADTVQRILSGKLDPNAENALSDVAGSEAVPEDGAAQPKLQDLVDNRLAERLKDASYLSSLLDLRSEINVGADVDSSMLIISQAGTDPAVLPIKPNAYVQAYRAHCMAQKTAYHRRALRAANSALELSQQLLSRAASIETGYRRRNRLTARPKAAGSKGPVEPNPRLAALTSGRGNEKTEARADRSIQMRQTLLAESTRSVSRLLDLQEDAGADVMAISSRQLDILSLLDSIADMDAGAGSGSDKRTRYERELAVELARPGPDAALEHMAFVLEKSVAIADALYSAILSHQREIQVRAALVTPDVHLVEPATVPTSPVGPDRNKSIRNGAGIGFVVVFLIVLMLEYGDARVRGVMVASRVSGAPILATLPVDETLASRVQTEHVVFEQGRYSPIAEIVRELRARLTALPKRGEGRTLLVTSPFPGDGKTFIASNLAVSLAQLGEKVLLIDGDLRRSSIHLVFGTPNARGLSDLTDIATAHELVRSAMLANLHILTSGPSIEAPAEFMSRARTQEVLRGLFTRYDWVVIDTPPINLVADASAFATLAQHAILVVRDGGCTESELAGAAERVRKLNIPLAGLVLNRVKQQGMRYGYGYGGYGRYDYAPRKDDGGERS